MQREYPDTPIPTVGAVIMDGERVLLIQRGKEPNKGQWTLPGGAVELGETIRLAIEREVREECGIAVRAGPVIDVVDIIKCDPTGALQFHYVLIDMACRYSGGQIKAGDDVTDVRWLHPDEFDAFAIVSRVRDMIDRAKQITFQPDECPAGTFTNRAD